MTREELTKKMVEEWDYPQTVIDLTVLTIPKKEEEIRATYTERERTTDGTVEKLTFYILTDRDFIRIFTYPLKPEIGCGYNVYPLEKFVAIEEKALMNKSGLLDPHYEINRMKKLEVTIYFTVPDENLRKVYIATKEDTKERNELRVFIDKFRETVKNLH